jgi:hypothetical protein
VYSPNTGKPEITVKNPQQNNGRYKNINASQNLTNINLKTSLRNTNQNISFITNTHAVQTPTKVLRDYLNKQDIRLAVEIAPSKLQAPLKKDCILSFVTEIEGHNPQ